MEGNRSEGRFGRFVRERKKERERERERKRKRESERERERDKGGLFIILVNRYLYGCFYAIDINVK